MNTMKKTAFILGAAMVGTPVVEGQVYADALDDYALNDLSAILAAYDVGDYSGVSNNEKDYNLETTEYDYAVDSSAYSNSESEYEEVGPVDVEFGDYPSGFDDQYFDGDAENPDLTDERLRPNKFEFEFDTDGNVVASSELSKLGQAGIGDHVGTDFNNCRICNGDTASQCITNNIVETCDDSQTVCQVTYRITKKGNELEKKEYFR